MKRYLVWLTAIFVVIGMGFVALVLPASGTNGTRCVPKDAYDYEVKHPAVTHEETVVVSQAVWANFAPNDERATFVGPPVWPGDERGTWITHKDLPPGHEGPDGVYAKGNPDKGGNWFYRQAEVTRTDVVVDKEAWVETIHVPAVVCPPPGDDPSEPPGDDPSDTPTPSDTPSSTPTPPADSPTPPVVTETPVPPVTQTPTTPVEPPVVTETPVPPVPPTTETPTPEPPKDNPPKQHRTNNPPPQLIQCVDGVWVITQGDEVLSRSGTCEENGAPPVEFAEQGV